jgi:hypothetical protein
MPLSESLQARQEAFLEAFVEHQGVLEKARQSTGTTKQTFYRWLQDELFRDRFDHYRIALAEEIESEAVGRVLTPEGQRGSDALATTLLKGLKRERYGEKEGSDQNVLIVYQSGLRENPRPGLDSGTKMLPGGESDGPDSDEGRPEREDQPGVGVADQEGPPAGGDRDFAGGARGAEDYSEGSGGLDPDGARRRARQVE